MDKSADVSLSNIDEGNRLDGGVAGRSLPSWVRIGMTLPDSPVNNGHAGAERTRGSLYVSNVWRSFKMCSAGIPPAAEGVAASREGEVTRCVAA